MAAAAYEFKPGRARIDLFSGLLRAKRQFGAKKEVIVDGDERVLTYGEIIQQRLLWVLR